MFWPVMLADRKGQAVKQRFPLWFGTQVMLPNPAVLPSLGSLNLRSARSEASQSRLTGLGTGYNDATLGWPQK